MTTSILVNGTGTLTPITLKKNYLNSIGTDSVLAYDAEQQISPTSTGKTTVRYYYHTNQLGSIIAISTSTGVVVQKYTYNAHGKPYIYSGSTLTPLSSYTGTMYSNTRLYTGREFENDTGYYYMRARYHSSDLGRFISRDPIGQNDQVNLYTYVANSPLKYTDRFGKEKILIMYSPNHFWDFFSFEKGAYSLKETLKNKLGSKRNNGIEVVEVKSDEDIKNAMIAFEANKDYKYGHIVYVGHNRGWLSSNVTDTTIKQLPKLSENTDVSLLSCSTFIDGNDVTWSNQIAKKLANQLNVPVSGSNMAVNFSDGGGTITVEENSWNTALPGGEIKPETGFFESIFNNF